MNDNDNTCFIKPNCPMGANQECSNYLNIWRKDEDNRKDFLFGIGIAVLNMRE